MSKDLCISSVVTRLKDKIDNHNATIHQFQLGNPVHLFATGFGSGLSPIMPGTMGTIAAIIPYLLLVQLPISLYILVCAISYVIGIQLCDTTGKDVGIHDHGAIVWDEFVGFWIAMLIYPLAQNSMELPTAIFFGFVTFRLFDMIKPYPISWADQEVQGGNGVMLDDLLAGLMALGTVYIGNALMG
jgi:phosphatidylglycerophosphatase A